MLASLMQQYPGGEQLEWNRDNDNFEVLRRSDLLISDFSGVIFDYALIFGRPVLYADTSFDKSPYDACWLEEELWTFRTLPKIGRKLSQDMFPQLRSLIDEMTENPEYRAAIETARKETWANRGEAAERVADYMIRRQKRE